MMDTISVNRATLRRWYDKMWAECDSSLVPKIAGETYLRHDITGANNAMTSEQYGEMVGIGTTGSTVIDFSYCLIAQGDYVGSIGRMLFDGDRQWDWVQLFRLEDGKMVETWLPGMGGTDPFGFPQPWTAWQGGEIPPALPESDRQSCVREFYQQRWLANKADSLEQFVADNIIVHDIDKAAQNLTRQGYNDVITAQLATRDVTDLKLFMLEEDDLIIAVASWQVNGDKQWDITQAFRFDGDLIVETWLPSIGGTDDSLSLGPHSRWPDGVIPETVYRPKP
jgi:predicted SnoaL-like aldol condensation-catalyzing enzyme